MKVLALVGGEDLLIQTSEGSREACSRSRLVIEIVIDLTVTADNEINWQGRAVGTRENNQKD